MTPLRLISTCIVLMALTVLPASAATKLRLHNTSSTIAGYKCMDLALGPAGISAASLVTTATVSGTDIQVTDTAGGTAQAWISEPLSGSVTVSGTVTANIYGRETATSVNAGNRLRLYKYSGGVEGSSIITITSGSELTTSFAAQNFTGAPTSTSFSAGDRIVAKYFISNVGGTMASGSVTNHIEGNTDAADGSSWVQINESATFTAENSSTGLVLFASCGTAATTLTVTDDQGNTWLPGPGARDAVTSGFGLWSFFCPNPIANTRKIQVQSSAAIDDFHACVVEVAGMATSSLLDASANTIASTGTSPITSGSMTPTVSGDILFQWMSQGSTSRGATNWAVGTAGSPNITWAFVSMDVIDNSALSWGQYNSTTAVNPSTTYGGTAAAFNSIGVAFKTGNGATPSIVQYKDTCEADNTGQQIGANGKVTLYLNNGTGQHTGGMRIVGCQSGTIELSAGTSWTLQFPVTGNLVVMGFQAGDNELTAVPTSPGGWNWAATGTRVGAGLNTTRWYYATNGTPTNRLYLTFTLENDTSDKNIHLFDIAGAATAPFAGGGDNVKTNGSQTGTGNFTNLTITPSSSSGIAFVCNSVDFNTMTNVAAPWDYQAGYLPVNSTGNTAYYENNGLATCYVTNTSADVVIWSVQSGLGANVGNYTATAAFFSAPAQVANSAFPRRKYIAQ